MYITVTTAADVLVGSILGVHTIVKVIGLTSPAATREGNMDMASCNLNRGSATDKAPSIKLLTITLQVI